MRREKKADGSRKGRASKPRPGSRREAILIVLVVCAVYFPCVFNGFIWDDEGNIYENPTLTRPDGLSQIWGSFRLYQYYPLTFTSFYLEHKLWGMNPMGYHITNVLLHALNSVLVFSLLQRLGMRRPLSFFTAMWFAVHPIQAESVAWATERKNLLSGFFYFSSFLFYLKYLDARKAKPYALGLLAYFGALLSKTATLTLSLTLLLVEALRAGSIRVRSLVRVALFLFLGAGMGVVTAVLETYRHGALRAEWSHPLAERMLAVPRVFLFYASKIVLPIRMSFLYPQWEIDPARIEAYGPAVLLAGLLALLWRLRKRIPPLARFGLGHYFVTLLPASGLVNFYFLRYSFVQNHFQYLAGLGILIVLALSGAEIVRRSAGRAPRARLGWVLGAAVVVGCSLLTFRECRIYRDEESLWRHTIAANPEAWLAHNNLGRALVRRGEHEEAMRHFRRALEIRPSFPEAHVNVGLHALRQGDVDRAMDSFETALAARPAFAVAHRNLAEAYAMKEMHDEAIEQCRKALALEPDHAETHVVLGSAYRGKGMLDEAERSLRRALGIKPNQAVAYYNLGFVERDRGRWIEAASLFERAAAIDPSFVDALNELGNTYLSANDPARATAAYQRSLAVHPNQVGTHYNLGLAYQSAGKIDEAISHYNKALEIQPDFSWAHFNLALAYVAKGEHRQAIVHCDQAVRLGHPVDPAFLRLLEPHRESRSN